MKEVKEYPFGEKWTVALPGSQNAALKFAVEQWITLANAAVDDHGFFAVALSGGSTPKLIYERLTAPENKNRIPWDKVYLFWSDERSVPVDDLNSNYRMAMVEGGFSKVAIPKDHIFRMIAEKDIEANAYLYEMTIKEVLKKQPFDLIMLGLGDNGHIASLFPHTEALHVPNRLVVANFVPELNTWRMSFTYDCINHAKHISLYVLGANKAEILETLFLSPYNPDELPCQRVGSREHKAFFIIDDEASSNILSHIR